jgi:hypothetical protein
MSVGDPHEHDEIPEAQFVKAKNDPRFQAILARGFHVSFDYDIPYLGGYSRDGTVIYIDRDVPAFVAYKRRKIRLWPTGLVGGICTHEHWEKTAMLVFGWNYTRSHTLANRAEDDFVTNKLGMKMALYNGIWDPLIKISEHKLKRNDINLPPDLDRTPYE